MVWAPLFIPSFKECWLSKITYIYALSTKDRIFIEIYRSLAVYANVRESETLSRT